METKTQTVAEQMAELCKLTRFQKEMGICMVAFKGLPPETAFGALRRVRGELAKLADYSAEHGEGFKSATKPSKDGKVTLTADGAKITATGSLWTRLARQAILLRKQEAEGELLLAISDKSPLTMALLEWATPKKEEATKEAATAAK